MSITKEIWVNYIVENLYNYGNEFLNELKSNDEFVLEGKVVHKTQNQGSVTVVKDRNSLPATITEKNVADATYALSEYTSDPELIKDAEKVELSYDRLASVMFNHMAALGDATARDAKFDIVAADSGAGYSAAQVIRTSGNDVATHLSGATGNRKLFTESDLQLAKFTLNKQKVGMVAPRLALIPSDLMQQLYDDLKQNYDYSFAKDVIDGAVKTLHGFKLVEMPETVIYNNTANPVAKAVDATSGTTDNDTVICLVTDQVARARGEVNFFGDTDKPEYYGDIYSSLVRFKVQKERADARGVVSIVQAAGT